MPKKKRPYPSLKTWRHEQRLNQDEAAELLLISQPYYSRVERQKQSPNPRLAKAISEVTGVPLENILGIA